MIIMLKRLQWKTMKMIAEIRMYKKRKNNTQSRQKGVLKVTTLLLNIIRE